MTTILDFPDLAISGQLFHSPGAAVEGGFTTGGARVISPEPGGFAMLEIQLAMQTDEWANPSVSWLLSKANGQVFKVRLAKTPQVLTERQIIAYKTQPRNLNPIWYIDQPINGELQTVFTATALEGTTTVVFDMAQIGPYLKPGHVIGHHHHTYLVDAIEYDAAGEATVTVSPPLRRDIAVNDELLFRPWFVGTINNMSNARQTYDAANAGMIQPGAFSMSEAYV